MKFSRLVVERPSEFFTVRSTKPSNPTEMLNILLDIIKRCGVAATPEKTVVDVQAEVSSWCVLPDHIG